jgi:hypothetical protein
MAYKTINLKDAAKEVGVWNENHIAKLKHAALRGITDSLPMMAERSPVDTGHYANSWEVVETDDAIYFGNTAPHAAIIEYGARPFTPPLAPLLAWAKRKLQDSSQPPDYSPEVQALARAVRHKISLYGMAPKRILEQAIPDIIGKIKAEFGKL